MHLNRSHLPRPRGVAAATAGAALVAGLLVAPPALADGEEPELLGTASDLGVDVPTPDDVLDAAETAIPGRWLVEVEGEPVLRGGSSNANERAQEKVSQRAEAADIRLEVKDSYVAGWNGMSVAMDDADVEELRTIAGVTAVYPVLEVEAPEPADAAPKDVYGNAMTGADIAQNELGLSGEGVTVGVIDSGIDYNHPDLGGSGTDDESADFPNDRVVGGYDFVGDEYDASVGLTPKPDELPDDCGGHGTHVAGIIGADGEITGVAPQVDLMAYRVFGCEGSSSTDVILGAMERAMADEVDVVNMSLGASFVTWQDYPTAQLADAMSDNGITMVISAGNEGAAGTFSSGAPGVSADAITVASVDNTHLRSPYATAAGREIAYGSAAGAPTPPTEGELALVAAGAPGTPEAQTCTADGTVTPPPATGPGQALLIERGTCSFHAKALAGQEAGYDAVILYNNETGMINPTVEGDPAIEIPVVMLTQQDGLALQEALAAGGVTWSWQEGTITAENPTAGLVSEFSSYGLTAELQLKPDVSAPGGSIWSTLPLEQGGAGSMSGTSMAAPHVAGAAALLLEDAPDLAPQDVKTAMMNTADQLDWSLIPDAGYLEPVHRQGAGLLDVVGAVQSTTRIDQPSISLGEGEDGPRTVTVTVSNDAETDKTYTVGARHGIATGAPSYAPAFYAAPATVELGQSTVTVPAGGSAEVTVTLGEDFGTDGMIYGGWLTLTGADEELSVPFAGLSGDYQALTVLDEMGMGLPVLGVSDGAGSVLLDPDGGHTYTMQDGDVPYVAYMFAYPVERLEVNAYRINGGGKLKPVNPSVGSIDVADHLGRTAAPSVYSWDGTYALKNDKTKSVKNGDYVLEFNVLKPLGDPENPEHWETFTSPEFTIENPNPGKPGAR